MISKTGGTTAAGLRENDFISLMPGKGLVCIVNVPVRSLGLNKPGVYEMAVSYRLQGDGAPFGVSIRGKRKTFVDLLLGAYRCDLTTKVKLQMVAK